MAAKSPVAARTRRAVHSVPRARGVSSEPASNPLAAVLAPDIQPVADSIESAGRGETISLQIPTGQTRTPQSAIYRASTNEECAQVRGDIVLATTFDARRRLPGQVAKWLRQQAKKLLAAADRIEEVPDSRNLAVIKGIVDESQQR